MNHDPQNGAKKPLRLIPAEDPILSLRPRVFDVSCHKTQNDEQFEVSFFEDVLASDPCNEDVLMFLGHIYTRRGDYERGLSLDERLARLRPWDATALYNLACSYSLLKRTSEAFATIEKALSLGYRDLPHMLKDPDLENLRDTPRFRGLIARLLSRSPSNS